ncbi:isochorismatase family protein [Silvanigrella sp.]
MRGTGKRNLVISGVTTDVCMVPSVISAVNEGFKVHMRIKFFH